MNDEYILLQEIETVDFIPTESEIEQEAELLGITHEDKEFYWIANDALRAHLPRGWEPYQHKETGEILYFNTTTGQKSFDHPSDEYYRSLFVQLKHEKKMNQLANQNASSVRNTATTVASSVHDVSQSGNPSDISTMESRLDEQRDVTDETSGLHSQKKGPSKHDTQCLCMEGRLISEELKVAAAWMNDTSKALNIINDQLMKSAEYLESHNVFSPLPSES